MTSATFLFGMIIIAVAAIAVAVMIQMREKSRQEIVDRTLGVSANADIRRAIRRGLGAEDSNSLRARMLKQAPSIWAQDETVQQRLVKAGYDSPIAPLIYSLVRVVVLVALPLIAFIFIPKTSFLKVLVGVGAVAMGGLLLPPFALLRLEARRQERIKRSLPDALDLLVVCVEAGISLDAAILRVAKDLMIVHPELAGELLVVSRKTNAGMTREDALRGLWDRTGVDEVRALVASLLQSEKWGSSSSRVLRVSSETLRRKRRQTAERKAATAPLKMIVPMAIFIFPALFVVILGPAVIQIIGGFGQQ
ncbi:MAG TPA: type II secretion system F family protein [Gemmatimonadaceae bacterium]|nr:type II secretion system F family protein [Gemmatimonadaceae bacterium]